MQRSRVHSGMREAGGVSILNWGTTRFDEASVVKKGMCANRLESG